MYRRTLVTHLGPDPLPRAQFREYEEARAGYAETRDGNGLPIFGSLRQSHRRRERDVPARHVFRRKLQGTSTPRAVLSGSCEPVRCRRQISGRNFGRYAKRVAIARAIALKPKYLFCDEPNSGLDPKTSLVIDELIHSITHEDGTTTIINTHDMNSVMGIGEHILYIYEGHREWEGTKDEVMNADNERLNSFIFASDLFRQN